MKLAEELTAQGHPVAPKTVSRLLEDHGYSLRANTKTVEGKQPLLMTSNLVGHMVEFYDAYRDTLVALGHTGRLRSLDDEINHRATTASTVASLQRAGFEVTDTTTDSFTMRYVDGTSLLRHYFIRLGFSGGWKNVVDPQDVPTVFAELEQRLNERAQAQGSLDLTIPTACFAALVPAQRRT